ncbi:MAG: steroid delta-isomerase [Opitutia bacterium Tous-C4FEB]|nr:MAG: steroid delta-isomerase [Opitutae bacterium Tous-C5TDCM]PAW88791.1 MAG: steroid delta-isomerase [Opitutae bacterium Tous-C4FEB]
MNAPAAVVQRQLDAYNARDVDAFLATYAADARQFEHPDKRLATGHAEMRPRFLARFEEPNLHARLLHRIVAGATVIDHELITRTFPEGPGTLELVAIYEIRAGLIAEARFITGTKTLAARS